MMMKRKTVCLTLCLALLLAAFSLAVGEANAPGQTRRLRLGSSMYTIEIDGSYTYGNVTEEDAAGGEVAYLSSEKLAVDFDVYQLAIPGDASTLEDFVREQANARGDAGEVVANDVINGIPVGWYRAVETYNGVDYQTVTYVMDDGEDYVQIVFWLDGEDAEAEAQGMIQTLARENLIPVRLGSSPYWVFCSDSFHEGGMTSGDVAEGQVAYWQSEETLLDFDVYQFSKEGQPERLADYVAEEASGYDGISELVTETTVNDIPVGWYRTVEEYEGQSYNTLTCILDAGTQYIEVVFWLDGLTAGAEVDAILHSLWMDEIDEPAAEEAEAGDAEAIDGEIAPEPQSDGETAGSGDADDATKLLRLGTSPFTMDVPASFTEGEVTQEDIEDDMVAYYYSPETMLDFDVYQFNKDGYPNDLAVYAQEEADGYNSVSELVTDGEINGIPAAWYRTVEAYKDTEFNTLTYILDAGDEYVEVVFWLDGENADTEADAIIRTLSESAEALGGEGALLAAAEEETATAARTVGAEDAGDAPEAAE